MGGKLEKGEGKKNSRAEMGGVRRGTEESPFVGFMRKEKKGELRINAGGCLDFIADRVGFR